METDAKHITSPKSIWKRIVQGKETRLCFAWIALMVLFALFADFIANEKPLYAKVKGKSFFPILADEESIADRLELEPKYFRGILIKWRTLPYDFVIWAPIVYSPNKISSIIENNSPFGVQLIKGENATRKTLSWRFRHWLGTSETNRDLAAEMVHGARTSLAVGLGAILIIAIIGIFFGAVSGYFGDNGFVLSRAKHILLLPTVFFLYFYGWYVHKFSFFTIYGTGDLLGQFMLMLVCSVLVLIFFYSLAKVLEKLPFFTKKPPLRLDLWISKLMEILQALPTLLLIISLASLFREPPLLLTILLISFTAWPGIARLVRAECLRIRKMNYIEAGRMLGFSDAYLIRKHVLPNALPPVWIALALGIGNVIIAEASLSFLNIGIPEDLPSWGKLLDMDDYAIDRWWQVIFPGLFIFLTVLSFNLIAERLRDILDPKDMT